MVYSDAYVALSAVFGLLGRLHRRPPADDAALADVLALADDWPLDPSETAERGLDCWRRARESGEPYDAVVRDQDRLYGVSATAVVAPFESVHRDEEPLVFGPSTLDVRRAYLRAGLRLPDSDREPDDHLGLEFGFVAQLLDRAREADEAGDPTAAADAVATARGFLAEHVLHWAPDMLRGAADAARTDFMKGLALLSLAALESARRVLDVGDAV